MRPIGLVLVVLVGCHPLWEELPPRPPFACVPADESCNGIDDDCDGRVDERAECCRPGETRPCGRMVGVCHLAVQACDDRRQWAPCPGEAAMGDEQCNGVDDDCDGSTDEGFFGRDDGTCNGVDDDCDGRIDEAPPCNGCPVDTAVAEGWVCIPAGTFTMGSADEAYPLEGPSRHVTISQPLLMEATEASQGEWFDVMGTRPSWHAECGDDCPVERVSWFDAIAFAAESSQRDGFEICYRGLSSCEGSAGAGCMAEEQACDGAFVCGVIERVEPCDGYRLPTEAEWEYAARAGSSTQYWFGDDPAMSPTALWCDGASVAPSRVTAPNRWGLYETAGNVEEWVADRFDLYPAGDAVDPMGPMRAGLVHIVRGGHAGAADIRCRPAARFGADPTLRRSVAGLRRVRSLPRAEGP